MWWWVRAAKRSYDGPGLLGEIFDTKCFQGAVERTTGYFPPGDFADDWLKEIGLIEGSGGCLWFESKQKAAMSYLDSTM